MISDLEFLRSEGRVHARYVPEQRAPLGATHIEVVSPIKGKHLIPTARFSKLQTRNFISVEYNQNLVVSIEITEIGSNNLPD